MMFARWNVYAVVVFTFVIALILSVYPLPLSWRWWRPEFVLVLSIYWISVFPLTISLFFLCAVGLFQDLLEGVPLGQHSLSLVIVAYICVLSHQRVRNFALWRETGWVFVLVGLAQLPDNWVQSMGGRQLSGLLFLAPAASSAIIWPLCKVGLDRISRHYRIY